MIFEDLSVENSTFESIKLFLMRIIIYCTKGISQIMNCYYLLLLNTRIENLIGSQNFIVCANSNLNIENGKIRNVTTSSPYIFTLLYSNFSMNNSIISNFYPQFLYGTFASINIMNSYFGDSSDKANGIFEVVAIKLEYNVSFQIRNNDFFSLENSLHGPVKI